MIFILLELLFLDCYVFVCLYGRSEFRNRRFDFLFMSVEFEFVYFGFLTVESFCFFLREADVMVMTGIVGCLLLGGWFWMIYIGLSSILLIEVKVKDSVDFRFNCFMFWILLWFKVDLKFGKMFR